MNFISDSVRETLRIGRIVAAKLQEKDIVCLFGQLGTGKTVLTKGIAEGLGIKKEKVISPTFVLVRQYQSIIPLYHFDLYRLGAPKEILSLGYEEYFYDEGITVIEWADRLGRLLPKEYLKVELTIRGNSERLLKFTAFGDHYRELLEDIHENIRH